MKNIYWVIYCIIILGASIYSLKKPAFNWDILPYMGVILSYDHVDAKTMHDKVYTTAKEQIPSTLYGRLTDINSKYRTSVAQSADAFHQQLPFYVVKPLYTGFAYLLYKAGISLTMATVLPSAISYFIIGLLLFYWIKKYWSISFAFMGSILIMFSPPLLSAANLSTPDALSGLLLFSSLYLIIERRSLSWAFIFLLLAIFDRIDNIIPAIFFLTVMTFFTNEWKGKITLKKYILFLALLALSYFAVSFSAYSFGWGLFYYPGFIKQLNPSYNMSSGFIFKDYIALAKSQFMTGLFFSLLSFFFLLILLLFSNTSSLAFNRLSIEQIFSIAFVLIIITRFILQPLIADRLYIPYYLSVIVFLLKKYSFSTIRQTV